VKVPCAYGSCTNTSPSNAIVDVRNRTVDEIAVRLIRRCLAARPVRRFVRGPFRTSRRTTWTI
jgi:hypothetical protein